MEKKLAAPLNLAEALDAANVRWAVGGSLMLYLRGATEQFQDIDLAIASADMERAEAALDAFARRVEPASDPKKARIFRSAGFRQYVLDGTEVELMAGITIETGSEIYIDPFDALGPSGSAEIMGRSIPLGAMEDWYALYARIPGREGRLREIEIWWRRSGQLDAGRLERRLPGHSIGKSK